jgi:hypothetical protein
MTTLDTKTTNLLEKVRKGATAGLSAAQFCKVLEACGFGVETYRRDDRSKAYHITTDSSSFRLEKQPRYRHIVLYDVLPWAKEQGLVEKVCALLGKPTLEEEQAAKAAAKKTSERRFTCGCCFGEFKTVESPRSENFGKMVRHGYERPGHGYIEGGCWGEHTVPFEVSKKTTERFLAEVVRPALETFEAELQRLENAPQTVTVTRQRKTETLNKGDEGFDRAVSDAIYRVKNKLYYIRKDVALIEHKLEKWIQTWEPCDVDPKAPAAVAYAPKGTK